MISHYKRRMCKKEKTDNTTMKRRDWSINSLIKSKGAKNYKVFHLDS